MSMARMTEIPPARNKGIEDDAGDRQSRSPFFDGDRQEKGFGTLEHPDQKGEGEDGHDPELITGDGQKMGCSCSDKVFLDILRDVSLLPQHEGLKDPGARRLRLSLYELTDPIPPSLDLKEQGVFKSLTDLHPSVSYGQKADGVNPFKGEMAFVGEDARVSKSPGGIEPADKSKTVPCMERTPLFLQKEKERPLGWKMTVGQDGLLGFGSGVACLPGSDGGYGRRSLRWRFDRIR